MSTTSAPPSSETKLPWLEADVPQNLPDEITPENPLRVVIAGGGVGGLLAAKYLKMQGHDVSLFYVEYVMYVTYSSYKMIVDLRVYML